MFITLGGADIFFDVIGPKFDPVGEEMVEKPTLIVLHGGPGFDHSSLRPYFDQFSDTHQVIYIDHRGNGRSTGEPSTWHLDQWADDIDAFCTALGIEKPVVFGQSFGGMVAMHYAARHPDGPSKVILSSTAAQFRMDATEAMMTQLGGQRAAELARAFFTKPSKALYEEYSEVCLPLYSQTPPQDGVNFRGRAIVRFETGVHFFREEMMEMDMRAEIAAIPCPTLVLGGMLDPVTPPVCSEEIAKAIGANARLEMFEGCGHGVHRDKPELAAEMMRAFFCGKLT